ncbi:hypothetical protein SDC9_155895 [bioreactor metagenome]|uniref:Uncharacterized protein n=1 Tax=bioreactor metagenome TaxID=1076179 RepID=A0A645F2Y0_9ZZZZ
MSILGMPVGYARPLGRRILVRAPVFPPYIGAGGIVAYRPHIEVEYPGGGKTKLSDNL